MEKEILSQINDIEQRVKAECEKHNMEIVPTYFISVIKSSLICCFMAERRMNRGIEKEQVTLFPTKDCPSFLSLLHHAAVCCYYAKKSISEKPSQSIFLLSAAHFYFGQYCQFGEQIHAGKFERKWNSGNATKRRHEENRVVKNRVIQYYKKNKDKYPSKDKAAESIMKEINVHRSFRTVRAWLNNQ